MIGIYRITNKINGKTYIGQSINIEERWKKHIKGSPRYTSHIHSAIKKYGVENFEFAVLLECPANMLNVWERDMIALYDSYDNGYNLTLGGEGCDKGKNSYSKDYIKEKMRNKYWPTYYQKHYESLKDRWKSYQSTDEYKAKRREYDKQRHNRLKNSNNVI